MPPPEKPLPKPKPKPKPPKPRPKKKTEPAEAKPMPARPAPGAERDGVPPILQQPFSCETYRLCPPPPGPPATLHLRSGRLPTPLIAVSAALLAISALLLLALLVRYLVRRRRGQYAAQQQQEAPPLPDDDEESVLGTDTTAWGAEEEEAEVESGDVHHVWFIRTKGLDERAIAAIAAVVYDSTKSSTKRAGDDGGCAVCLAEFRDGETLRLLPRCGHAFHRACIDTWLRAHVNCPLCRSPVQVPTSASAKTAAAATRAGREEDPEAGGERAEEAHRPDPVVRERAVRRAASMVTVPRRAWPDVQVLPASSSGREEDMATGLAKIRRLLKFSEAWDIGAGRSASFGAGSRLRLPTTARSSGPSTANAGGNGDEIESSR